MYTDNLNIQLFDPCGRMQSGVVVPCSLSQSSVLARGDQCVGDCCLICDSRTVNTY